MDNSSDFFLLPHSAGLPDLSTPPVTMDCLRMGGERLALDPARTQVSLTEEHPQVDRMQDDLGAICEVFKQNRYFYADVTGFLLAAGDVLSLYYADRTVILTVLEIENGRARIDLPAVVNRTGT